MPRFIEQFYYGNIEPQERSTKMNKSVQKQLEIMMKCEDCDNPFEKVVLLLLLSLT